MRKLLLAAALLLPLTGNIGGDTGDVTTIVKKLF
jgi:hypothetical protein